MYSLNYFFLLLGELDFTYDVMGLWLPIHYIDQASLSNPLMDVGCLLPSESGFLHYLSAFLFPGQNGVDFALFQRINFRQFKHV
jgi:hypothetical protein